MSLLQLRGLHFERRLPEPVSKTELLVADVLAAGGRLTLTDEARGGVNWRQRSYAARRRGKVREGKYLSVSWTKEGFEISSQGSAQGRFQRAIQRRHLRGRDGYTRDEVREPGERPRADAPHGETES
jgi:hypothetical protein